MISPDLKDRFERLEAQGTSVREDDALGWLTSVYNIVSELDKGPGAYKRQSEEILKHWNAPGDHGTIKGRGEIQLRRWSAIEQMRSLLKAFQAEIENLAAPRPAHASGDETRTKIFIGHGRSEAWRELKDFLKDRLGLEWEEYNRTSTAGRSRKEILLEKLAHARFAFLVMTAEDEHADGTRHARENVIHEIGLFQGALGFERAIVLLEDGCEEFSNIAGLDQIRFPSDRIEGAWEEVRRVLERERILG